MTVVKKPAKQPRPSAATKAEIYQDMARALALATLALEQAKRRIEDCKDAISYIHTFNPDIAKIPLVRRAMEWPPA